MLVPKQHRQKVYEYLFKEGVMVASNKLGGAEHRDIGIPNLHVIKLMKSLKSRGFVREGFAWCHYYWFLTNEGIMHLRDFLNLPAEIIPATLKRQGAPRESFRARGRGVGEGGAGRGAGTNREYRRSSFSSFGGGDKKSEVGAGANETFQFRGGYGRGRNSEDTPRPGFGGFTSRFTGDHPFTGFSSDPSSDRARSGRSSDLPFTIAAGFGPPGDSGGFGSSASDQQGGFGAASDMRPAGGFADPPPSQDIPEEDLWA
ncbi:small ribosomal subunit protein eS10-like [Babylonia areolata]|uniref:small ribosomal subunit protein eS10-like n=1 Tax=Babylonia areolata TaxID=304850 RepID=UPI003FD5DB1D